jgi:hypothetical protein
LQAKTSRQWIVILKYGTEDSNSHFARIHVISQDNESKKDKIYEWETMFYFVRWTSIGDTDENDTDKR